MHCATLSAVLPCCHRQYTARHIVYIGEGLEGLTRDIKILQQYNRVATRTSILWQVFTQSTGGGYYFCFRDLTFNTVRQRSAEGIHHSSLGCWEDAEDEVPGAILEASQRW